MDTTLLITSILVFGAAIVAAVLVQKFFPIDYDEVSSLEYEFWTRRTFNETDSNGTTKDKSNTTESA